MPCETRVVGGGGAQVSADFSKVTQPEHRLPSVLSPEAPTLSHYDRSQDPAGWEAPSFLFYLYSSNHKAERFLGTASIMPSERRLASTEQVWGPAFMAQAGNSEGWRP